MKAIVIGDDQSLGWEESPHADVDPGAGDVAIRVVASAINRADLVQRSGGYPPPPGASPILGLECSGVIESVGSSVTGFAPGDEVCALLAGGGYAERVVCPAQQVLPVPAGMAVADAATLPEVFATAYLNLFMEASLQPGERVLLHAGASGVGTAGIQMCNAFGNPCHVTAGSAEKIERCVALGASGGSSRHDDGFAEHVEGWTDGNGFDVILDPVGAGYLADNLAALSLEGRLVIIGLMGGAEAPINLGLMMMKRLRIIGSTLRARSPDAKGEVMQALHERVWPRIENGEIQPVIEARFAMHEAEAAHELVASNSTFGKVLLET